MVEFIWNTYSSNPETPEIKAGEVDPYLIKDQMIAAYGNLVLLDIAQVLAKNNLAPDNGEPIYTKPHTHNDGRDVEQFSDGVYVSRYTKKIALSDGTERFDEVMISFFEKPVVRPNGVVPEKPISSRHKHTLTERYMKFGDRGKVFLRINDTQRVLLDTTYVVEPENWHQVEVDEGPVVLIIHMIGAGGQSDDVLHNFGETISS